MTYTKQTWHDLPATDTPISAARLGRIEDGIASAANDTYLLVAHPGDGIDAYDAFQDAIISVEDAGGGTVRLISGKTYTLSKLSAGGLKLARNNDGSRRWVTIDLNGATVELSANVPRFLDFNRIADDDSFQKIRVCNGTVDAANVGGRHHVVIGNLLNDVTQNRVNLYDIVVEDITVVNVPVDPTDTNIRRNIWLVPAQSAASQAVTNIERIRVSRCQFYGGHHGVVIAGINSGTAGPDYNFWLDDILIEDCYHTLLAPQSGTAFTSANFHIGSRGHGRWARILRCHGRYSGDVGIEINGFEDAAAVDCEMWDALQACFHHTNFTAPSNPTQQTIEFVRCTAGVTSSTTSLATHAGFRTLTSSSLALNAVTYRDCSYKRLTTQVPTVATGGICEFRGATSRLLVDGLCVRIADGDHSDSGTHSGTSIYLQIATPCLVILRNLDIERTMTRTDGIYSLDGITLQGGAGSNYILEIDGMRYAPAMTGGTSASLRLSDMGNQSQTVLRTGTYKNIIYTPTGDPGPRGFQVRGTSVFTITNRNLVEDCDFSDMPAGTEVFWVTGVEQSNKFVFRHNIYRTASPPHLAVTAADTLTIPDSDADLLVSGTTTITTITALRRGTFATLRFASTPTLTNGSALKLAGATNFVASAEDILTIQCDGTNWREVSRSVN